MGLGAAATEKMTDTDAMIPCRIVATPGVVVDGEVVHAGGLPKKDEVERWLAKLR